MTVHTREQGIRLHHLANLGGLVAVAGWIVIHPTSSSVSCSPSPPRAVAHALAAHRVLYPRAAKADPPSRAARRPAERRRAAVSTASVRTWTSRRRCTDGR